MALDFSKITDASALSTDRTYTTTGTSSKGAVAGSQDYFLKLLVAQMNNQDPLNPLDSAQMTSQLAQLNTVQGINNLATKLDSLLGDVNTSQSLQATALVGHTVLAPGNALALANGQAVAGIDLSGAVDKLTVSVKNAAGTVIHTADLGKQEAGVMNFVWDGSTDAGAAATPGNYTFAVAGTLSGKAVDATTLSTGVVTRVTPSSTGASLLINGVGTADMTQIRQIY